MRKVLIVAYHFPPVGGPSVQRTAKFVKYLPSYGWQSIVLTVKNPDCDYFDNGLLSDIPSGTIVVKASSVNFWRFWRSKKYGDRSLYDKSGDRKRNTTMLAKLILAIIRPIEIFVNNFIFIPDDYSSWFPFAFWEGLKIIKKERIDIIYATGSPWTSFMVARCLSIFSGIPFVLDFRDPWVLSPYATHKERTSFKHKVSQRLEYFCIKKASRIININENITKIFKRYYKGVNQCKFITILHGFDNEDFVNIKHRKNTKFVISHVGTFYHNRKPDNFLNALNIILKVHPHMRQSVEVRFIGITGSFAEASVRSYGLDDVVRVLPYCSHKESILEICSADLLILIQANIRGKKAETTTGKVYEYLASGNPILALVSKGNEVGQIIRNANAGVVIDPIDSIEIANFILNSYKKWERGEPQERLCRILSEYDRKNLAGILANNFNVIIANNHV